MSSVRVADTWHTTTFRLTLTYGALFVAGVTVLLAFIYVQTASYINQQVDHILKVEAAAYSVAPPPRLSALIADDVSRDVRHINLYGLFSAARQPLAGNVVRIPDSLPIDGQTHRLEASVAQVGRGHTREVNMLGLALPNGLLLVIGRDETQLAEIRHIILVALAGAVVVALVVTGIGMALSVRPVRRIRETQRVSELIVRGDIHRRLPIAGKNDELDMLARIVNHMLDALERMLHDVKSASDHIAHDLRTPLTRLRAMLHRAQIQAGEGAVDQRVLEQSVAETDALLARFRALMRISEISVLTRRSGFERLELAPLLQQVEELYAPLADDKGVGLSLSLAGVEPIQADGGLLFEAVANLVDNAIKFTPAGGRVRILLRSTGQGPRIDVMDDGAGIGTTDLAVLTQPFYRGDQALDTPGFGLGLSIVSAILHLHDFRLTLAGEGKGTRATIECWPEAFPPP